MAAPASLRAPIPVIPGLQADQLQIGDRFDADGSIKLSYVGDEAAGLRLNPMFPGRLAFKPDNPAGIPPDPSAAGTTPIPGQLLLSISPRRLRALAAKEPSLSYPLVLVYHNVELDPEFFSGTVLTALSSPSGTGFKKVKLNGRRLNSAAELSHAFASGQLDFWIWEAGEYSFPLMPAGFAGNERVIDLTLGVRTHFNPFHHPPLSQLPAGTLTDPETFIPLPMTWWVSRLRQLSAWNELLHNDFAGHPFWDAVVAATPDYRRVRIFLPGERPATSVHIKAYEQLLLRAALPDGSAAWSMPVNRLGDLFLQAEAGVDLVLSAEHAGTPQLLGTDADAAPGEAEILWPTATAPTASQSSDLDLNVGLDLRGDPLTLQPAVLLYYGLRDSHGLTIDRKLKRVAAEQELVQPLQATLDAFGWAPPTEAGVFGRDTRNAVRGFQRQARTTNRLDADGTVDPATVQAWNGAVTGKADAATLAEMLVWRNNGYRSVASDKLWTVTHQWSDTIPGSSTTYAENYNSWVEANLERFNNTLLWCNWFPILLLIEYAAAHGLRIKLRYWSPTDDPDRSPIHTHQSDSGRFRSKSHFYRRTKSTVTSRMIGELNTEPVPEAQRQVGDLVVLDYGADESTWHSYVITGLLGGSGCHLQSGTMYPEKTPRFRQRTKQQLPDDAYQDSYRRWKFADFD